MAEGLKAMALEGHGVAFLPLSAVRKDLRANKLVSAAPPELKSLSLTMEVRAYRERPTHRDAHKPTHAAGRPDPEAHKHNAQALWDYLIAHHGAL
jgi:DNA-binding transcriptional LysR family regulator